MRNKVMATGVLVLAVLGGWVVPAAAQDAKAAEILAAARKAIGDKKVETMKALSVQARVQRNVGNFSAESDVEMLLEMPDKYLRSDTMTGPMGGAVMSTGFNGEKAIVPAGARMAPGGGMVMTMSVGGGAVSHGGAEEKPTAEQLEQMNKASLRSARTEISRLMLGWVGMAHPSLNAQYSYVGEAESPDGKAHVIDVKDADGFAARLFIDQNSKLPLMVTYKARQPRMVTSRGGGEPQKQIDELRKSAAEAPMVEFSLFFEDWKDVDGVNFPHTMRRASAGQTTEEWTITKVKVNPKIDPKKFETK